MQQHLNFTRDTMQHNTHPPKTAFEKLISEKEKVVGCLSLARSGNTFDLMFYVESKLKKAGWSSEEIQIVFDQAMDNEAAKKMGMGGYDFLLTILTSVLTVEGTVAEPIDEFLKRHGLHHWKHHRRDHEGRSK